MADLTIRQTYAAYGRFKETPSWFKHVVNTGKPTAPDTSSLSAPDLIIFNAWLAARENGAQTSQISKPAYSTDVEAMISSYETYFASASYTSWAHDDLIGRDMQWRVRNADLLHAVESGGVVPISADPAGVGSNALVSPVVNASAPRVTSYNTGSGNFVVPPGTVQLIIEVWGAGGGGRSGTSGNAYGGGSGGYSKKTLTIVSGDWNTNVPYSIGNGGAGHSSGSVGNGSAGGNSTVGSVTLNGVTVNMAGNGGAGGTSSDGTGGSASGGDTNITGGNGAPLQGGNAPMGGLGGIEAPFAQGYSPGGGGGGGVQTDTEAGGTGANGSVKFTWS